MMDQSISIEILNGEKIEESERLNILYRKVKELTDGTHRTVEQSMHLLRIEESDREKILNEIADDKDRYRWNLKQFLVFPSYENLKKLHYFYFDYDIVIYGENDETLDINGDPIDLAKDEPSEEELELSDFYSSRADESEFAEYDQMQESDEEVKIWEHWQFLEKCLDKFIEEPSEDTLKQYMEARKWVQERENLRQCMEEISQSPTLAENHDFVVKTKKRIEQMDLEILSKSK